MINIREEEEEADDDDEELGEEAVDDEELKEEEEEEATEQCSNKHQRVCSWNHLPRDIFLDIFSRLPIKSVMGCRCVCKDWNFTISNPHFIKLHLSRAPQADNPDIVFSTTDFIVDDNPNYVKPKVSLKKDLYIVENVGSDEEVVVKPLPLPPHLTKLEIVDSLNGLLCLTDGRYNGDITVYVCNPFTGESTQLPTSSSIPFKAEHDMYGFGFDPVREEYKVLRLVYHSLKTCLADCKIEAEVCTLGSSSWRRVGEAPFSPFGPECCVYLDSVIHCIANCIDDGDKIGIGSFDVVDETLAFDPLLPQMLPVWNESIDIGVLGGCLSVVNYSSLDFAEVWVLTQSGEYLYWTSLFVLSISDIVTLRLLCLLNNGEILFLSNNEELLSCHPFGNEAREIGIHGMSESIHSFVHVGTFVSPIMGHGVE